MKKYCRHCLLPFPFCAFLFALMAGPLLVQAAGLANISTRMEVLTGNNVLIAGFIITGTAPKKVLIRGIGPSLNVNGVPIAGALADPRLQLYQGGKRLSTNDNWKTKPGGTSQEAEIRATKIPPTNDFESAILVTLAPGEYTAILAGNNSGTGLGLVEVYDLAQTVDSKLANISTRGFVQTNDQVMIGGVIVTGATPVDLVIRGLGPSLNVNGVPLAGSLQDPALDLYNANGVVIQSNDNWQETPHTVIEDDGLAPTDPRESAMFTTLDAGSYTAIVAGKGATTGIGLVEVYELTHPTYLASKLTFNDGTTGGQSTGFAVGKVVTDADTVFWFDYRQAGGLHGGSIRSVLKTGGAVKTLASGLGGVNDLVSDGTTVFWTEFNIMSGDGSIKSVAKIGGPVQVLASGSPPTPNGPPSPYDVFFPGSIAVDTNFVYWGEDAGGGAVRRVGKAGGAVTDIGRGLGFASALTDGAFFYEVTSQQVRRMPITGSHVDVLANYASNNPMAAILDATKLYWAELTGPGGKIDSIPKAGGKVTTLVSNLFDPHSVAVDDGFAYYFTSPGPPSNSPGVSRVPKAGGPAEVFYSFVSTDGTPAFAPPEYLAVDSSFVYCSLFDPNTSGQGEVVSLSK
jgi:hypothetical protein